MQDAEFQGKAGSPGNIFSRSVVAYLPASHVRFSNHTGCDLGRCHGAGHGSTCLLCALKCKDAY